jgi:adenylyltransferase/sulfurtransferase
MQTIDRYIKNTLIEGIGEAGQDKLRSAVIAVVGAGGLGSAASLYLAAAGIGRLLIIDCDIVELKNLQRQIVYSEGTVGASKTEAIYQRLKELNSQIDIRGINMRWESSREVVSAEKVDIILDCVDDIGVKFKLNDFSVESGIALVHCGVVAMQGQITTVVPGRTGCLRCIFSDTAPDNTSSDVHGILGPAAGNMGTLQAMEAIKYITGAGMCLENEILFVDYRTNTYNKVGYKKNTNCICGGGYGYSENS